MMLGIFWRWGNFVVSKREFQVALIDLHDQFLPARRYASAGYRDRNVSVCPSVCPSVRHAPVLCQNEES